VRTDESNWVYEVGLASSALQALPDGAGSRDAPNLQTENPSLYGRNRRMREFPLNRFLGQVGVRTDSSV
jgi:hypothetical protein